MICTRICKNLKTGKMEHMSKWKSTSAIIEWSPSEAHANEAYLITHLAFNGPNPAPRRQFVNRHSFECYSIGASTRSRTRFYTKIKMHTQTRQQKKNKHSATTKQSCTGGERWQIATIIRGRRRVAVIILISIYSRAPMGTLATSETRRPPIMGRRKKPPNLVRSLRRICMSRLYRKCALGTCGAALKSCAVPPPPTCATGA